MVYGFFVAIFVLVLISVLLSVRHVWNHFNVGLRCFPCVAKFVEASKSSLNPMIVWLVRLGLVFRSDTVRAAALVLTTPFIPFLLLLSAINHKARKMRKIYGQRALAYDPKT